MNEIRIACIPAHQSIDLFSAVGNVLDAALGGANLVPGNGGDVAATIVVRDGQTERQAVAVLRQAANILAVAMPKAELDDEAAEEDCGAPEEPTTVSQLSRDETGWTGSLGGGAAQAAAEMAQQMLAVFVPAFEEMPDAANYLSWDAVHQPTGKRYSLIVVRPNGLTPHEARQRAEQESERLRGLLREAVELLDNSIDTDDCELDHNQNCQAHLHFPFDQGKTECYMARIKRFVTEHSDASE